MPNNPRAQGWLNGLLGVLIFSGSLPATRLAEAAFTPLFVTGARATIAGGLGLGLLLALRQKRPQTHDFPALLIVAGGVVLGFPLLTALALQHMTAAHCIIYLGLLPLATAIFAYARGGERLRPKFWLFALAGSGLLAGWLLRRGASPLGQGDLSMLAAIGLCGLGYAEGAKLSRRLGGWQVISWALVLSLPLTAAITLAHWPGSFRQVPGTAWAGLVYVSLFSMLLGFLFWYRGLALGGIAAVGQLQLLQPGLALLLAAALLHDPIGWPLVAVMAALALCVAGAKRYA